MATTEQSTSFQAPGQAGSPVLVKERYENFIGGHSQTKCLLVRYDKNPIGFF